MRLLVEADGGSRGNPGPAGYGAVVCDPETGEVLAERSAGLGIATNNVAEYQGLIAGLRAALELAGAGAEVEVRMDSKLVVEQMSGRWQVKHPAIQPLAAEAAALARQLGSVRYTWVPRKQNERADRLANEAMDTQAEAAASAEPPAAAPAASKAEAKAASKNKTLSSTSAGWTGQRGEPTRLLLLRHGQTTASAERRYSGRQDPELTEFGRAQAVAVAKGIRAVDGAERVSVALSSPLRRARQTAEPVAAALGLEVGVHEGLLETDFGAWDGLTFAEARQRDPELHRRWLGDDQVRPPGGESFAEVGARVAQLRDELVAAYPGQTLLLVTHVTPIKWLIRIALDVGPSVLYRMHLDLASLSIADFYPDGGASVRLVNGRFPVTVA